MSADDRVAYIEGLRTLAEVLEAHPEIPLPYEGSGTTISINFLSGDDPRAAMAAAARAIPSAWAKRVYGDDDEYLDLTGSLAGLRISLSAFRETVCKRVVTGIREVTETVKDPAKLAEVPEVKVTRTEEIVTWDCGSLLSPLTAGQPEAVTP